MATTTPFEDSALAMFDDRQDRPAEVDLVQLVQDFSPLLFRVAHSLLRDAAEAEDTVQDTLVRVLEHRARLAGVEDMRVWLVRITWNLALDRKRRTNRQKTGQLEQAFVETIAAQTEAPDRAFARASQLHGVLEAIDRLPARERQALLLAATEELTTAEIAAILSRSESATRALLFRARTRLRERLERGSTR